MCVLVLVEYVSLICLIFFGVFLRVGVIYDDIEDVKIVVSEVVINVVKYVYKENNNVGIINIYFEILEDKIKIVIFDKGDSFDYEIIKLKIGFYDKNENIDFLCEGGLGLFLIEFLMDEVIVYKEFGVIISMIKYIKKE